MYEHGIL